MPNKSPIIRFASRRRRCVVARWSAELADDNIHVVLALIDVREVVLLVVVEEGDIRMSTGLRALARIACDAVSAKPDRGAGGGSGQTCAGARRRRPRSGRRSRSARQQ